MEKEKIYWGIEYADNEATTTGDPHPYTGNMCIAMKMKCFFEKSDRDKWVSNASDKIRIKANMKTLRSHCRGELFEDFLRNVEEKIHNMKLAKEFEFKSLEYDEDKDNAELLEENRLYLLKIKEKEDAELLEERCGAY